LSEKKEALPLEEAAPKSRMDARFAWRTRLVDSRIRKRKDDPSKTETYRLALPHVVEMLVNHRSGHKSQVAGVYNKAKYLEERREALELWAAHLLAKVEAALTPQQRNCSEKPEEVSNQLVSGTRS